MARLAPAAAIDSSFSNFSRLVAGMVRGLTVLNRLLVFFFFFFLGQPGPRDYLRELAGFRRALFYSAQFFLSSSLCTPYSMFQSYSCLRRMRPVVIAT